VRLNTAALPRFTPQGRRVPLLRRLATLRQAGQIGEWVVSIQGASRVIAGRVGAIRKTEEAIQRTEQQSSRAQARATLGREFPTLTLSIMRRVPSPAFVHVSCAPSKIPDSGFSPVRLQAVASLDQPYPA
jgi:hypothetical protein